MPRGGSYEDEEGGLEEVLMGGSTTRPSSPDLVRAEAEGAVLSRRQRYAYGVGHMFNDLSATCWFSYLLVYLQSVANLSNATAGARRYRGIAPLATLSVRPSGWVAGWLAGVPGALSDDWPAAGNIYLLGHVVDALCTPTVGIASDKTKSKYGRRKVWHLVGSIAGILSFPFILSDPCACMRFPSDPSPPLPLAGARVPASAPAELR
jgi:hypothetical protein